MARGYSTKRRRLTPPDDDESSSRIVRGSSTGDFYSRAAEWDLEQDYERRPRKANKKDKESNRLPIKTSEGLVHHNHESDSDEDSDSFLGTDEDEGDEDEELPEKIEEEEELAAPKVPLKLQIVQAKEDLARIAALINEDPEEHISSFKTMADMADNGPHVTIKKLALASQAAVYKDVIPGYKIRPLSGEDMSAKISKEVRKLRSYEQSLLSGYRNYVQKLSALTKPVKADKHDGVDPGLRSIAITCACSLLTSVPHFNFRVELLKILVSRLARRQVDADFIKCRETLEEIFSKDDDGIVSLEAVRLLSKMMKAKEFRVHESVLNTFLHLRLLSEFSSKGSKDRIDKESDAENDIGGKKRKQKREFRTKKERKIERERKAVEKDMKEADALVSHEEREKNQAETLKLVFGTYFRILKLRIPTLMGPVLEGLAKYAHLINQDFFGDLLEALKDLISHAERNEEAEEDESDEGVDSSSGRDSYREILLCTVTAFALLKGQDVNRAASSLHLDLSFFIKHLYRSLYALSTNPDVEYNPNKSLRLPDPTSSGNDQDGSTPYRSKNQVNFQTPTVLLLRCLQSTLLSRAHGNPPPIRLGSFTKRLLTTSLQLPEKSALATLSLLNQVAKHHGRRIAPLWHTEERKGDGVFNPFAADVEGTNVFAGTVWEGELLRLHYCPQVRDAALSVEKAISSLK
ncbi:hypothetical protein MPDQ_007079 [Monascus purpureus]|uniref:Nucleolar complex-associated protein 3 n=1 Tax=Monascus purpureus TaxID=5098 RepID=A0A507R642_MONPU|nr:hypothetical protein MPDQ_007079 [Monascus purpureus]BDD55334.1 hypothetical protein MAP00_000867 [Monascus purpureus]